MSSAGFEIAANVLIAGSAAGAALVLTDTLSFWGGFDPQTGEIIDVHHPQYRQRVGGSILIIPESRGSAGTPGGIAETLRNGSGPRAFVLGERDVNISVGVLVANRLYDLSIPVVEITPQAMSKIGQGERIEIDFEGTILVNPEAG
ncbi:MAG: aconitase X swivel domain-containing protein [Gammaproteobacteria bacterium]